MSGSGQREALVVDGHLRRLLGALGGLLLQQLVLAQRDARRLVRFVYARGVRGRKRGGRKAGGWRRLGGGRCPARRRDHARLSGARWRGRGRRRHGGLSARSGRQQHDGQEDDVSRIVNHDAPPAPPAPAAPPVPAPPPACPVPPPPAAPPLARPYRRCPHALLHLRRRPPRPALPIPAAPEASPGPAVSTFVSLGASAAASKTNVGFGSLHALAPTVEGGNRRQRPLTSLRCGFLVDPDMQPNLDEPEQERQLKKTYCLLLESHAKPCVTGRMSSHRDGVQDMRRTAPCEHSRGTYVVFDSMADSLSPMELAYAAHATTALSAAIRLLLVEDDASIRFALSDMLDGRGLRVTTVVNGREALDELRQSRRPTSIVLDLMMPVMDGWEFRVEQRADPLLAGIPLLAMSADLSAKARAIAADGYVRKPIDFPELLRQLRERRRARREAAARGRRSHGRPRYAGLRHRARDQQPAHVRHRESADAGRARSRARPTKPRVSLRTIVADALDGAERIRKLVKQVQMVSPGQHRENVSTVVALREAVQAALALTENQIKHRARSITRSGPGSPRPGRPRAHRAAVREPAAQRRPGDPRGARPAKIGSASACASCPASRPRWSRSRTPGAASRSRSTSGSSSRSSRPRPIGQGTGLGLSICRGIVTALGGQISFQSDGGKWDHVPRRAADDGGAGMRRPPRRWARGAPRRTVLFRWATLSSRLRCSRGSGAAPTSVTGMFGFC